MELAANTKRQAHDAIAGYGYQFWSSVYAWIQLDPGQSLFIEGAEDFDIAGSDQSEAVQVKRLAAPVTLRTACIIESIKNALELFAAHEGEAVFYRFVTTAEATLEKGSPFGQDLKGLDLWTQAISNESHAESILRFLVDQGAMTDWGLNIFETKGAGPAWKEVFSKITFDLGAQDTSGIKKRAESALVLLGEKLGVAASQAKKAATVLLSDVIDCASSRGSKPLDRVKLLETFESCTHNSLPVSSLVSMLQATISKRMPGIGTTPTAEILVLEGASSIPPLPDVFLERPKLVKAVQAILDACKLACVSGGTGVGKSTIARLVANAFKGSVQWLHVGLLKRDSLLHVLSNAVARIKSEARQTLLVIDDVALSPSEIAQVAIAIRQAVADLAFSRSMLLVTMQRLPSHGWSLDHSADELSLRVPMLVVDEIVTFLDAAGCPTEDASRLAIVLHAQTFGHMQLVHARLRKLSSTGWLTSSKEEVFDIPVEVQERRREARMLLVAAGADLARELIYRLSVWGTTFRHEQILYIAAVAPSIPNGGDVFTELVGPWIEAISADRYRLSPLLHSAANEVWTQQEVLRMRCEVAVAILQSSTLSLTEFSQILMTGLQAGRLDLIGHVIYATSAITPRHGRELASAFFWLPNYCVDEGKIVPQDSFLNSQVRLLQAHVARGNGGNDAEQFLSKALEELPPAGTNEECDISRYALLSETLVVSAGSYPVNQLLTYIKEFVHISLARAESPVISHLHQFDFGKQWGSETITAYDISSMALVYPSSNRSPEWYAELAEQFSSHSELLKSIFEALFRRCAFFGHVFIDKIWLAEDDSPSPDWRRAISTLDVICEHSLIWKNYSLFEAAIRAKGIVVCDYMRKPKDALSFVADAIRKVSMPSYRIRDIYATILSKLDMKEEALALWLAMRAELTVDPGTRENSPLFVLQRAAECAGDQDKWNNAKSFLNAGIAGSQIARDYRLHIGFMVDAGFAHWKLEQYDECVRHISTAVKRLLRLATDKKDLRTFKLWKTVSHVILHLNEYFDGPITRGQEARAAMCANIDAPEGLRNLPDPVPLFTVLLASAVEWKYTEQFTLWVKYVNRIKSSLVPGVQLTWPLTDFACELRKSNYLSLLDIALTLSKTLTAIKHTSSAGREMPTNFLYSEQPPNWREVAPCEETEIAYLLQACWVALIDGAARKKSLESILEAFAAYTGPHCGIVCRWANEGRSYLHAHDATRAFNMLRHNTCDSSDQQNFAAITVFREGAFHPEMALTSHALLIAHTQKNAFRTAVSTPFGNAVQGAWRGVANIPSLLRNPRFTVTPILNACDMKPSSLRSSANIVLAGVNATSANIGESIKIHLREVKLT